VNTSNNRRMSLPTILVLSMTLAMATGANGKTLGNVFKDVNPSVVEIRTVQRAAPQLRGTVPTMVDGLGSGVLISPDRVLTASHVVEMADRIDVIFLDGRTRTARIVASERFADVALLALDEPVEGLAAARLADSDRVEVGDQVFLIGAPYGVSHTFTVGYVSGLHRSGTLAGLGLGELIQTDAAINIGSSGGPMFNSRGEVIGIVSHITSRSGGFEGLGFAISINTAKALVIDEKSFWSGVSWVLLPPQLARALNAPQETGLLVQQVVASSPAARLGLRAGQIPIIFRDENMVLGGDIILSVNNIQVDSPDSIWQIRDSLRSFKTGDSLRVEVFRSGQRDQLELTLYVADSRPE